MDGILCDVLKSSLKPEERTRNNKQQKETSTHTKNENSFITRYIVFKNDVSEINTFLGKVIRTVLGSRFKTAVHTIDSFIFYRGL